MGYDADKDSFGSYRDAIEAKRLRGDKHWPSRINLMQGDCLEMMKVIPDGSVDMVLCDLPYGTTQNSVKREASKEAKESPYQGDIFGGIE